MHSRRDIGPLRAPHAHLESSYTHARSPHAPHVLWRHPLPEKPAVLCRWPDRCFCGCRIRVEEPCRVSRPNIHWAYSRMTLKSGVKSSACAAFALVAHAFTISCASSGACSKQYSREDMRLFYTRLISRGLPPTVCVVESRRKPSEARPIA